MIFSDAQGKVCYNGGTLHLNTLECTCPSLYYGRRCNKSESNFFTKINLKLQGKIPQL